MKFNLLNRIFLSTSSILSLALMILLSNSAELVAEEPSEPQQLVENSTAKAQTYPLVYKFQANQVLKYSINHSTSVDTSKDDYNEINTNESITQMHYRVVSIDSENQAILEPVLDQVKMSATFAESEPITYDSANEKIPAQFTGVNQSIGKPLSRFKFNSQGKLLEILDLRNAGKGDPNLTNATVQSVELLGNQNFLAFFPDHPVSIGEKWNEKYEAELKVSESLTERVKYLRKFELESVENGQSTIKLSTILISQVVDPKLRVQLIQKAPTGNIVFDIEKGVIISRELNIDQTEFGIFGDRSKIRVSSKRIEKQIQ